GVRVSRFLCAPSFSALFFLAFGVFRSPPPPPPPPGAPPPPAGGGGGGGGGASIHGFGEDERNISSLSFPCASALRKRRLLPMDLHYARPAVERCEDRTPWDFQ